MYGLTDKSYRELLEILASIPEIDEVIIFGFRANVDRDGLVLYQRGQS